MPPGLPREGRAGASCHLASPYLVAYFLAHLFVAHFFFGVFLAHFLTAFLLAHFFLTATSLLLNRTNYGLTSRASSIRLPQVFVDHSRERVANADRGGRGKRTHSRREDAT